MVIIYFLCHETLRFSQLKRKMPQVTEANLTEELRMLEQLWLGVSKVPPQAEYSLTESGQKFVPVLEALEKWAIEYQQDRKKQ